MNILIDCHVFDGKFQGTRTYLEGLYTHMTHHKDIDFFFAAQNTCNLKKVFGASGNIHYVQLSSGGSLKRLAIEFPRIIKEFGVEYAHFQYVSPLVKRCKEIVTIHDLLFLDYPQYFPLSYRWLNKYMFKRSAKRADLLLTVSKFSKDEIIRHFGIDCEKISITYNSVLPSENAMNEEVDLKQLYGLDKYILYVGRIEPRKNHLTLLKAFIELGLHEKGYKLVMVGVKDLNYKDFFTYYDGLAGIQKESVLFLQVPFSHLVSLYRNAKLFVFPSFAEGFGIPPLEALAYGCPLLCSNVTAMSEFGLPDENTFNPSDIEELKSKMKEQLLKPIEKCSYKESVLGHYDWQVIADTYYEMIKKM